MDVASTSGALQQHVHYDAFGNMTATAEAGGGSLPVGNVTWTGQRFDVAISMYNMRGPRIRSEHAAILAAGPAGVCRWQRQPAAVCGNSPTNATDPSGLQGSDQDILLRDRYQQQKQSSNDLARQKTPIGGGFNGNTQFDDASYGTDTDKDMVRKNTLQAAKMIEKALDALENLWPSVEKRYGGPGQLNDLLLKQKGRDFYIDRLKKSLKVLREGTITFEIEVWDDNDVQGTFIGSATISI